MPVELLCAWLLQILHWIHSTFKILFVIGGAGGWNFLFSFENNTIQLTVNSALEGLKLFVLKTLLSE